MNKHAVKEITDTLTSDAICERLEVSPHSVRYARTQGLFPSGWYKALDEMCSLAGINCPLDAFNFKVSTPSQKQEAQQ